MKKGLDILDKEIAEQFLPDGGHFELSPMYHSALVWDLCELVLLACSSNHPEMLKRLPQWKAVISRGVNWLRFMVHPDQNISFFNDAAFGIAPTLRQLESYSSKLECLPEGIGKPAEKKTTWCTQYLEDSGYISISDGFAKHQAIVDVGKIGPDYQPGHAHADTLSFELSLFGQRVFVNSGTSQYEIGPERDCQRGTASHNTVIVDGKNSSAVWAGFRVAKRANPFNVDIQNVNGPVSISASHDGYSCLINKVCVRRDWLFSKDSLAITDLISGQVESAVARLYCHPDVVVSQEGNVIYLSLPQGNKVKMHLEGESSVQLLESFWHPYFGESIPNTCIEIEIDNKELNTLISWGMD